MKAGPSNPQQGFVCTDRAKVHLAGNYFWSSEFCNRAGPNPARMGDSHYDGLSCPRAGAVSLPTAQICHRWHEISVRPTIQIRRVGSV
jgi:hypothetical protein